MYKSHQKLHDIPAPGIHQAKKDRLSISKLSFWHTARIQAEQDEPYRIEIHPHHILSPNILKLSSSLSTLLERNNSIGSHPTIHADEQKIRFHLSQNIQGVPVSNPYRFPRDSQQNPSTL